MAFFYENFTIPYQLIQLVEQVTPGDVRVASAKLNGTFKFCNFFP